MARNIELVLYSEDEILGYIDDVIQRFSAAISETGIEHDKAYQLAKEKVITDFFPGKIVNDQQHVFHIKDAESENAIGWLWLADRGHGELRVADIQVNDSYRRLGYATVAMQHAQKFAEEKKFNLLSLNVFAKNTAAICLYKKLDYSILEEVSGKCEMRKEICIAPNV